MKVLAPIIIAIVLASALAPAVLALQEIPLDWRDTGYDLAPGYRYSVSFHDEYVYLSLGGAIALSALQAGPLLIKTEYTTSTLTQHIKEKLVVYVNGEEEWESDWQSAGLGSGSFDWAVTITCSCDGNCVVKYNNENVATFTIQNSVDIMEKTETVHMILKTVRSRVTVTTSGRESCGSTTTSTAQPPNLPPGPGSGSEHMLSAVRGAMSTAAGIVVVVLGIIVIMLILAYLGGAKKLAKRAIG